MSIETILNKCIWRKVAENDAYKIANNDPCITLTLDNYCHKCNGLDYDCPKYVVKKSQNNSNSYQLNKKY